MRKRPRKVLPFGAAGLRADSESGSSIIPNKAFRMWSSVQREVEKSSCEAISLGVEQVELDMSGISDWVSATNMELPGDHH